MNAQTSPLAILAAQPAPSAIADPVAARIAAAVAAPSGAESMLATRAMLARPTVRVWTARRKDRRATADVIAANHAGADAGTFWKSLLPKDAMSGVTKAAAAIRRYHYAETLPWADDGARLLPVARYDKYTDTMRDLRHAFQSEVSAFIAAYDSHRSAAAARLGGLFRSEDYPDASAIAGLFGVEIAIYPVPTGADFRVDVGDAVRADLAARVADAAAAAVADAMADAADRIAEVARAMADKLAAFKPATFDPATGKVAAPAEGIFRDSLIGNVRDLADLLPGFNIAGSPRFADLAARVAALGAADPDALRSDPVAREQVATEAAAVAAEAAAIADNAAAWF